ncbi:hypothetical protein HDV01_001101 [Terramyces sp. JEL0728]|nr:hypothetical protein HDV01_001101 [Terramyces sp. JEL0728]
MATTAALVIIATTSLVGYKLLKSKQVTKMKNGLPFPHTYMSHRGGSREWVENTLPGFRYSASINADILEMDVQMTKDGEIVVFHDNTLEKMCGDFKDLPKLIVPQDLLEKKQVVNNPDSYRIPLFESVLKEFPNCAMQVDCKNGPEELVIKVGKMIQQYNREKITVWGSFKPSINEYCHNHFGDSIPLFFDMYRGLKSVMLYKIGLLNIMEFRESALICPDMTLFADRGYVKAMNERGVSVIYFGRDGSGALNDPEKWERARSLGANERVKTQQHGDIPKAALQVIDAAKELGIDDVSNFYSVESDYYEWPLEQRRDRLQAPSIDHLCKSLLFENTKWRPKEGQDNQLDYIHPKYILVVVQYTDKINNKKLNALMKEWGQQSSKAINMRIAPEEVALKLTGYGNNGVTPIGMLETVPVLLTDNIDRLKPSVLFLGAGHVDWKIALPIDRFKKVTKARVVDLSDEQLVLQLNTKYPSLTKDALLSISKDLEGLSSSVQQKVVNHYAQTPKPGALDAVEQVLLLDDIHKQVSLQTNASLLISSMILKHPEIHERVVGWFNKEKQLLPVVARKIILPAIVRSSASDTLIFSFYDQSSKTVQGLLIKNCIRFRRTAILDAIVKDKGIHQLTIDRYGLSNAQVCEMLYTVSPECLASLLDEYWVYSANVPWKSLLDYHKDVILNYFVQKIGKLGIFERQSEWYRFLAYFNSAFPVDFLHKVVYLYLQYPPVKLRSGSVVKKDEQLGIDDDRVELVLVFNLFSSTRKEKDVKFWLGLLEKELNDPNLLFRSMADQIWDWINNTCSKGSKLELKADLILDSFKRVKNIIHQNNIEYDYSASFESFNKQRYAAEFIMKSIEKNNWPSTAKTIQLIDNWEKTLITAFDELKPFLEQNNFSVLVDSAAITKICRTNFIDIAFKIFQKVFADLTKKLKALYLNADKKDPKIGTSVLLEGYTRLFSFYRNILDKMFSVKITEQNYYEFQEIVFLKLFTNFNSPVMTISNVVTHQYAMDNFLFASSTIPEGPLNDFFSAVRTKVFGIYSLFWKWYDFGPKVLVVWKKILDSVTVDLNDKKLLDLFTKTKPLFIQLIHNSPSDTWTPIVDQFCDFWLVKYEKVQFDYFPMINEILTQATYYYLMVGNVDKLHKIARTRVALFAYPLDLGITISDWKSDEITLQFFESFMSSLPDMGTLEKKVTMEMFFDQETSRNLVKLLGDALDLPTYNNRVQTVYRILNGFYSTRKSLTEDLGIKIVKYLETLPRKDALAMFFDEDWSLNDKTKDPTVFESYLSPHLNPYDRRVQRMILRRQTLIREQPERLTYFSTAVNGAMAFVERNRKFTTLDTVLPVCQWVESKIRRVEFTRLGLTHPVLQIFPRLMSLYLPKVAPIDEKLFIESYESNVKLIEVLNEVIEDRYNCEPTAYPAINESFQGYVQQITNGLLYFLLLKELKFNPYPYAIDTVDERLKVYQLWFEYLFNMKFTAYSRRQSDSFAKQAFVFPMAASSDDGIIDFFAKSDVKLRKRLRTAMRAVTRKYETVVLGLYEKVLAPEQMQMLNGKLPKDVEDHLSYGTIDRFIQLKDFYIRFHLPSKTLNNIFTVLKGFICDNDTVRNTQSYRRIQDLFLVKELLDFANSEEFVGKVQKTKYGIEIFKQIELGQAEAQAIIQLLKIQISGIEYLWEIKYAGKHHQSLWSDLKFVVNQYENRYAERLFLKSHGIRKTLIDNAIQLVTVCPSALYIKQVLSDLLLHRPELVLETVKKEFQRGSQLFTKGVFTIGNPGDPNFLIPNAAFLNRMSTKEQQQLAGLYKFIAMDPTEKIERKVLAVQRFAHLSSTSVGEIALLWEKLNEDKEAPPHAFVKKSLAGALISKEAEFMKVLDLILSPKWIEDRDVNVFLINSLGQLAKVGGILFYRKLEEIVTEKFNTLGVASMTAIIRVLSEYKEGENMLLQIWKKFKNLHSKVSSCLVETIIEMLNLSNSEAIWSAIESMVESGGVTSLFMAMNIPSSEFWDPLWNQFADVKSQFYGVEGFIGEIKEIVFSKKEIALRYFDNVILKLINSSEDSLDAIRAKSLALCRLPHWYGIDETVNSSIFALSRDYVLNVKLEMDRSSSKYFVYHIANHVVSSMQRYMDFEAQLKKKGKDYVVGRSDHADVFNPMLQILFDNAGASESMNVIFTNMSKVNMLLKTKALNISRLQGLDKTVCQDRLSFYTAMDSAYQTLNSLMSVANEHKYVAPESAYGRGGRAGGRGGRGTRGRRGRR